MEEVPNILVRVAGDSSALPETIHALADQSLDPVDPTVAQEVNLDLEYFPPFFEPSIVVAASVFPSLTLHPGFPLLPSD